MYVIVLSTIQSVQCDWTLVKWNYAFFGGEIHEHKECSINFCSVPTNLPTNHSLLVCVCLFLCGPVSFVVEGRRCVLFEVCHAVPVEGFGCRGVHKCTLIDCCMSAELEDCCWFVLAQSARELF